MNLMMISGFGHGHRLTDRRATVVVKSLSRLKTNTQLRLWRVECQREAGDGDVCPVELREQCVLCTMLHNALALQHKPALAWGTVTLRQMQPEVAATKSSSRLNYQIK